MNKLILLPVLLLLGGCASQAYYDDHGYAYGSYAHGSRPYSRVHGGITYTTVYDDWLDQPFWTLDPWYYPASAYRNYSYGVTWVSGGHWYLDYYSYPLYSYSLHYSPVYASDWWLGWSSPHLGFGHTGWHGLTDFWWHDPYPYTTDHGAYREVHRLRNRGHVPPAAHREYSRSYRGHSSGGYSRAHNRANERVRHVRGAHGYEDGHRGRSSIDNRHAGERRMPFNHAYRNKPHASNRDVYRDHGNRSYTRNSHAGETRSSARGALHRAGYVAAPTYSTAPVPASRTESHGAVGYPRNHSAGSAGHGLKPAHRQEAAHSTYSPAGHSSHRAPVYSGGERVHRTENPTPGGHGLPAARQRDHGRSSGARWPMMKGQH